MNVEDLPVAVIVLNRDRVIISANDAIGNLVGVPSKDLIGQTITDAMRPRRPAGEDLLSVDWHRSAYLRTTKRISEQDVLLLRADGTEVETIVDGGYDRDSNGQLLGATLLIRPRYRGPRRIRSGIRIVSAVSHELRSPLTSVRGYTTLLLKRWDTISDDDRKLMLQQIDRDARRVSRMIGELLDITRLEMGRLQLNRTAVDMRKVAVEVIDKTQMAYPDAQIELDVADDVPELWADADKIDQVLTNLIENACKYASAQGINIAVTHDTEWVSVEVSDQGPGIPAADMPRLFQQFFRSSQGRPSGTGLGLWISRGLIESHGGKMTAVSNESTGTQFRFTLPRNAFSDLHGKSQESHRP